MRRPPRSFSRQRDTPASTAPGTPTWNNADGDDNSATGSDDFWDFGTSSQYPALKVDLDGNGTPTWQEFGGQRPTPTPPGAPTGLTATAQGPTKLNLSWSAPSDNGGAPITAYDLRHIETGAADKSDANWTLMEDVWTTGSGPLQYSLTGLTGSTRYDVQVRAVNAAGESEWSPTVTETTAPPTAPEAPTGLTARGGVRGGAGRSGLDRSRQHRRRPDYGLQDRSLGRRQHIMDGGAHHGR